MKKVIGILFAVLLILASATCNVYAEEYSVDEVTFDIPEDYFIEYDVGEEFYYAWGFKSIDNDIKLTVLEHDNYTGENFYYWDLKDVEDYYKETLCLFPDDHTTIESTEGLFVGNNCNGFIFSGEATLDGEKNFFEIYLYVTDEYIYSFEFVSLKEECLKYTEVVDVVNSIYLTPYFSNTDQDASSESEDIFELLGPIFIVIFSIFTFVFKFVGKDKKATKKSSERPTAQPSPINIKLPTKKFELNGKSINAFNEKFTVGGKDENFARKELERERREREKMFQ